MFLSLSPNDVENSAVKGEFDGKSVNLFMRIKVDESTIQNAIKMFDNYTSVVAFDYTGDINFLDKISFGSKPVLVTREVDEVDLNIDFFMSELNKSAHLVCWLPTSFSDMRVIYNYSKKYSNIRFDGGNFLHIDGCRLGSILNSEVPVKIPESKLHVVTIGEASLWGTVTLDRLDKVEFYQSKSKLSILNSKSNKEGKSNSSTKKVLPSLLDLKGHGGLNNF